MAKFNASKIRGFDEHKEEIENGSFMNDVESKPVVGAGLLNEESEALKQQQNRKEIVYFKIDEIVPHPENNMSMNDIEELAQNIDMNGGIDQPLVVKIETTDEEGNVIPKRIKLLTGHRRLAAIKILREAGKWKSDYVECIVKDIDKEIDLPISTELKEKLAMRSTNKQRNKTDADLLQEVRDFEEIYDALRKAGVVEYENQRIKGVKTADLISQKTGISPAQVRSFQDVAKKGAKELEEALLNNETTIYVAKEAVKMPKEKQKKMLDQVREEKKERGEEIKITVSDINEFKEKDAKESLPEDMHLISKADFKRSIGTVQGYIKSDGVVLTEKEFLLYNETVKKLEQIFDKASKRKV